MAMQTRNAVYGTFVTVSCKHVAPPLLQPTRGEEQAMQQWIGKASPIVACKHPARRASGETASH
jgi:hypothetical protein